MVYCQALGCKNASGKKLGKSFHAVPDKEKRRELFKKWAAAIKLEKFLKNSYVYSRNDVICSDHFTEDDWEEDLRARLTGSKPRKLLKEDAVPSIFAHRPAVAKRKSTVARIAALDSRKYIESVLKSFDKPSTSQAVSSDCPSTSQDISSDCPSTSQGISRDDPSTSQGDQFFYFPDGEVKIEIPFDGTQPSSPSPLNDVHDHSQCPSPASRKPKRRGKQRKKLNKASPEKSSPPERVIPSALVTSCMTSDASTQTNSPPAMETKITQWPDDFSYIVKEHTYATWLPTPLKPCLVYMHPNSKVLAPPEDTRTSQVAPLSPVPPVESTSDLSDSVQPPSDENDDDPSSSPCTSLSSSSPSSPSSLQDPSYRPSSSSSSSSSHDSSSCPSTPSSADLDEELDEFKFCMDRKFIVFESQLDQLMRRVKCTDCNRGRITQIQKSLVGTMVRTEATCACGSTINWQSQPTIDGLPAGNLLASATLLFSGSEYEDLSFFANVLNLPFISQAGHTDIQRDFNLSVGNMQDILGATRESVELE